MGLPVLAQSGAKATIVYPYRDKLARDINSQASRLQQPGHIDFRSTRHNYRIFVDASAVFATTAEAFLGAVTSYHNFVRWGIPSMKAVHVIKHPTPNDYLVWNWLSMVGIKSKHCVHSQIRAMGANAKALIWNMVPCPKIIASNKQSLKKHYGNDPAFRDLKGSFYIETLKQNAQQSPRIYVRYYTVTQLKTGIPPALVHFISKFRLKSDIRKMLTTYANHALR